MRLRRARLLTAFAVMLVSALTVSRGLSIVRFVDARANGASREHPVDPWIATPGLAGAAREASLTQVTDPTDIEGTGKRAEELAALLAVQPLSSANWLSLAGMRLVSGQPYGSVLAATAMSSVTGANQGPVMMQRGIFGLLQWDILPADARRRVIADLVGPMLAAIVSDADAAAAKGAVNTTSAAARREIADLLRAEGVSAKSLARIGL
jgi:hypothetical protein